MFHETTTQTLIHQPTTCRSLMGTESGPTMRLNQFRTI
ncbi:hypothetical protein CKAH01_02202 [Colletotrichum kahawae]|uniref:Uncharacterized protein n=1 Tax=Colletotrichum kahawae TaxID=34407 RepID=A0AAE0CZB5_COLKA|nr:hypothetical protein CKAH01_02202 [Colletotrichum kahawae]